MRAALIVAVIALAPVAQAQETEIVLLSGTDKDNTVAWEFMVTGGRKANVWSKLPVPSHWEQHGFGNYNYGHDGTKRAPNKVRYQETGLYRHRFTAPAAWKGRRVRIVFEGAMTDTEVKINGQSAGPLHQGAFYRFQHDITSLLRFGEENLLEVTVAKHSANHSVNEAERTADFWIFGGIFRPVYLSVVPAEHIERVAIDARHDGTFVAEVFLGQVSRAGRVVGRIRGGGAPFSVAVAEGAAKAVLRTRVARPTSWSPERPQLYQVELTLEQGGRAVHRVRESFGFRTVEVRRHDGLYVNGVKVRLKGVNRHTFWPDSGRVSSPKLSEADVLLIKEMNMNAVRMSHYPPDKHFLEAADRLGLFVLNELTGWQDAYDTQVGAKLVREMVTRDVNHPSVIFWDNGNEGGFNFDLDDDYASWDPQKRVVLHPWSDFNGIDTGHYEAYGCCAGTFFGGDNLVMPTEFLHGLYDGGHGAGLADWWEKMLRHPRAVGGFLWSFADEGLKRTDRDGTLDTDGNHGPDGILGPYREKEGSFFAIREIWSPVHVTEAALGRLPPSFDGVLRVENRYHYTDLAQVKFTWQLRSFSSPADPTPGHVVRAQGTASSPKVPPQGTGLLRLPLPPDWARADALALTATDPQGRQVMTWTWMLSTPEQLAQRFVGGQGEALETKEEAGRLLIRHPRVEAEFDARTGLLVAARSGGKVFPLGNGPRVIGRPSRLQKFQSRRDGADMVVETTYVDGARMTWRLLATGWLRLDFEYEMKKGEYDHLGITFDLPEVDVQGMAWLGRGPYRVWKNRTHGVGFDVWRKAYNDTVTGETWQYPEFKGYHADLHWARVETKAGPLTVVSGTSGLYLRMLTPRFPAQPMFAQVKFPEGDLSFMHGIAPIGTKFRPPVEHGPAGAKNVVARHGATYKGTLYFHFGEPPAPRAGR